MAGSERAVGVGEHLAQLVVVMAQLRDALVGQGHDVMYAVPAAGGPVVVSPSAPPSFTMPIGEQIRIKDVWLEKGHCLAITVSNLAHHASGVFVMAGDPANPATWARTRSQAPADLAFGPADAGPPGRQLTYTAPRVAWFGVIVLNRSDTVGIAPLRYQPTTCSEHVDVRHPINGGRVPDSRAPS